MKLGFIKPNYPNERRVALLPQDIDGFENEIFIEQGFGMNLDIEDREYELKGCIIKNRDEIFKECDAIFSLKLIQESDYERIRDNQMIIGWTHPNGSGAEFMKKQAIPKNLTIVDLDNMYPTVYYKNKKQSISSIKPNFILKNSYIAGYSATIHALVSHGILPDSNLKVAILSCGNTAQGAFSAISKFNCDIRVFYRKTMSEFEDTINDYDIIINGIEVDTPNTHIISKEMLKYVKKGCLIIDAAADAGNAIEGTRYTSIDNPIYKEDKIYFYVVNNAPSIFFREASKEISKSFSKNVYKEDVKNFKYIQY